MVTTSSPDVNDPSSCANVKVVTVNHIHLDWLVDFVEKIISGRAVLDVEALEDAKEIVSFSLSFFHIIAFRFSTFAAWLSTKLS
jgi:CRISPR/Cas system-associated protein Cas7 (RAMP superfamily)